MNGKKKWGIGLMAVGVIGVLVALSVELPANDGQIDMRLFAGLAFNMALSPLIWVGAVGIFLWRSGSKPAPDVAAVASASETPTADGSPTAAISVDTTEAHPAPSAYPVPAPSNSHPSAASAGDSASKWSRPDLNGPASSSDRRFDRTGIIVAVAVLAVVAVLGSVAYTASQEDDQSPSPGSSVTAEQVSPEPTLANDNHDVPSDSDPWTGAEYLASNGSWENIPTDNVRRPIAIEVGGSLVGDKAALSLVLVDGDEELWYSTWTGRNAAGESTWTLNTRVHLGHDVGFFDMEPQCTVGGRATSWVAIAWREARVGGLDLYEAQPDRIWHVDTAGDLAEIVDTGSFLCTFDHWNGDIMSFPPD